MAKELPYFQFEPAQYLTGNIQFCSLEAQGLFINICAIYWQRECSLTLEQIKKKFNNSSLISELIQNDVIKTHSDIIDIEFLDEQFEYIKASKIRLSEAGKKGALIKKQATLKQPLSKAKATLKQLDKIREDKIKENIIPIFDEFLKYALEKKPTVSQTDLKLKYDSWVANDWKNGNDKKITNWKAALLNTLPYIKDGLNNNISLTDREEYMRNAGKM